MVELIEGEPKGAQFGKLTQCRWELCHLVEVEMELLQVDQVSNLIRELLDVVVPCIEDL